MDQQALCGRHVRCHGICKSLVEKSSDPQISWELCMTKATTVDLNEVRQGEEALDLQAMR